MTRPLCYAVAYLSPERAQVGRTFSRKANARRVARREGAVVVAKFRGHAGLTIVERFDGGAA